MNDETHFIFVVPMLAIKLGQHDFQIGCLWANIDDIRRDISTAPLELFYFGGIGRKSLFRSGTWLDLGHVDALVMYRGL